LTFKAGEIGDIGADPLLSPELVAVKLPIAQTIPQGALGKTGGLP
jgi:hypothetical protein